MPVRHLRFPRLVVVAGTTYKTDAHRLVGGRLAVLLLQMLRMSEVRLDRGARFHRPRLHLGIGSRLRFGLHFRERLSMAHHHRIDVRAVELASSIIRCANALTSRLDAL